MAAAVVGKGANDGGETFVVGGDGATVAKCAEVLAGIEGVGGGMTDGAGALSGGSIFASVCLCVVFEEEEVMTTAQLTYLLGIGAEAVEMDYHDGTGAGGDVLLDEGVVDLEGVDAWLYEDGGEVVLGDGEDGGDIGVGGDDDFIAGVQYT